MLVLIQSVTKEDNIEMHENLIVGNILFFLIYGKLKVSLTRLKRRWKKSVYAQPTCRVPIYELGLPNS